ncbi:unnamed protein product [Dracunculus medinensis]|uniref:Coiled-coil domain-containing protein 149 n=1 Tax=Dracunculus medinensis TaxID=318479 RepID=A0A0N4U594_DRAME|nr:unnamed protein product [Dracunculus medinensis]
MIGNNSKVINEIESLQKKCAQKTEVVLSLSKELSVTQSEVNKWKAIAENFERNLAQVEFSLQTLTKADVKDLRSDCKVLRQKIARYEVETFYKIGDAQENYDTREGAKDMPKSIAINDSNIFIENLEKLTNKNSQLQKDLQALLCEKEELICDRDSLNRKIERLSQELTYLLNGDSNRIIDDIDGLIAENRYLKAQLKNAEEETGLTRATLKKYHKMIKNKIKVSLTDNATKSNGNRISAYDAEQIHKVIGSKALDLSNCDYSSLMELLLDLCNDRQIALAHQRNSNKILGERIVELDAKILHMNCTEKSPSRLSPRSPFTHADVGIQYDFQDLQNV